MRTRKFLSTLIPALPMLLTALLVILVTVIFLTAMRSKAHAQFGGAEQPMFQLTSTGAYSVTNDPGMQYYWNYKDLDLGRITTWTDRVQRLVMVRHDTANGPTNTVDGLYFHRQTSRTSLTNTPLAYGTNQALCIIWKPLEALSSFGVFGRTTNGAPSATFLVTTPQPVGEKYRAIFAINTFTFTDTNFVYTNFHDLTLCYSNLTLVAFTNGVFSALGATGIPYYFFAVKSIGQDPTSSSAQLGGCYLREVMVITNVGNPWLLASNIHYYRTNTYGNTP